MNSEKPSDAGDGGAPHRRDFLSAVTSWTMTGGLVAAYGTFVAMALRFLYPSGRGNVGWRFVAALKDLKPGDDMEFVAPSGDRVVIARHAAADRPESFVALSNVCPHLGCQVRWEEQNNRFFCPCHNGAFDREGIAIAGPPAKAGQRLTPYPLKIVNGLLFIEVPLVRLGRPVARREPEIRLAHRPTREA